MLLCGMRVTKKKCILTFVLLTLCLVLLGCVLFVRHSQQWYYNFENDYKAMCTLLETSKELTVADVFEFDFDKAYVAHETEELYGDEEYFLKELNVDSNIPLARLETGGHNRILFIKNDVIVYEFAYDILKVRIVETGIWIFPDTPMVLTQQNGDNKEPIVQIDFNNKGSECFSG